MIINDNKTYPRNWICMALFTHNQRWKISRDKWFTYWWIHFQHVPDNRAVCEGRWMKHVNGSLVVIHARNVPRRRITCLDKAKPTIAGAHAIKNQSANVSFFFFFSSNEFLVWNRGTIVRGMKTIGTRHYSSLAFVVLFFSSPSFFIVLSTLTTGIVTGGESWTVHSIFHQLSLTIKIPCATSTHAVLRRANVL